MTNAPRSDEDFRKYAAYISKKLVVCFETGQGPGQ